MMRFLSKNIGLVMLILAAIAFTVMTQRAWGSDSDDVRVTQSNDMNNQTTGDVVGSSYSSDAFAFAHSLGDVDINQCMGSTQWGTIIVSKQKLVLNLWCAAEVYDAKGLRHMAAVLRCDIPEIAQHFDDPAKCIVANKISAPRESPPIAQMILEEEHEEDIDMVQAQLSQVQMELAEIKAMPAPRPRIVQAAAPPPTDQYSQEQKMAVFSALGIDEDEDQ